MKFSIYLSSCAILFILSSCLKGYNHEKIVTNNSRNPITVYAGCCDNRQKFSIQPGESETVFACVYQQPSEPKISDLNWEVKLIKDGKALALNQPEIWNNISYGRMLRFEYVAVD